MWDEAENGMGFAGGTVRRHALVIDYSRLLAMLRSWGVPYAALGRCMAIVISQAVMASDYSGSGGGVDAFIETFKNLDPQATKDCFK
jgi:hypothetical protein